MEAVYFTVVAIALYFGADWALNRIEARLGRRLEHRTLIFFGILLVLALLAFEGITRLSGP